MYELARQQLKKDGHMTYWPVEKSDAYKGLFKSVMYIFKTLYKRGAMVDYFSDENFTASFESTNKILQIAVNLCCEAMGEERFNFTIELEIAKAIYLNPSITEAELTEIILLKELLHYIRKNDPDSIYFLLTFVCSGSVRNELVPNPDWVNTPIG